MLFPHLIFLGCKGIYYSILPNSCAPSVASDHRSSAEIWQTGISNPSGKTKNQLFRFSALVFVLLISGCLSAIKKNGRRKGDATTVNKKKVELKYNSFYVIFNLSFLRINSFILVRFLAACAKPEHPDG